MVRAFRAYHGVIQAFILCLRRKHALHLGRYDAHVKRHDFQFRTAAVQSAHIKYIVDKRKQIRRELVSAGEVVCEERFFVEVLHSERNHALDSIERRANLMTHLAQEVGAILRHGESSVALADGLIHFGMGRRDIDCRHKHMGSLEHACKP